MSSRTHLLVSIDVEISTVLIGADESVIGIDLPDGYTIRICDIDDYRFKSKIMGADCKLLPKYHFAKLNTMDFKKSRFICLEKQDKIEIRESCDDEGKIQFTDTYITRNEKIQNYKDVEFERIYNWLSALQIYKNGDISINEIFMNFRWDMGILKSNFLANTLIADANTICENTYCITDSEKADFRIFYSEFKDALQYLEDIISNFTYAKKILSADKAAEILVTTLEMSLLGKNQQHKKEVLSKRVAVQLHKNDTDLTDIYEFMKLMYKKRSESTHEGTIDNVIDSEFERLENIVRLCIKALIKYSLFETNTNKENFKVIRSELIGKLKNSVTNKINEGLLV
jgi:hypothetical protein